MGKFLKKYGIVLGWVAVGLFIMVTDSVTWYNYMMVWLMLLLELVHNIKLGDRLEWWMDECFKLAFWIKRDMEEENGNVEKME